MVWEITCVSIAAQLATFPLGLLYFHQFPSYFLLSNLLVIPAAFIILYMGVAYFALGWIPGLGWVLGKGLSYSILALNQSVVWVESLPGSLLNGIDINILETWLIYLLITASIIFFFYQRRKALLWASAVLAVLMLLQVREVYSLKRYNHLVVYDVRGQSAINLVGQDVNLLFCDSLLAHSPDRQQFHLRNNWNRLNAPEPQFITDGRSDELNYLGNALFSFKGKTFCRLDRPELLEELAGDSIPVDYLLLSFHYGMRPEEIFRTIRPSKVILDSTIKGKTIERIKEKLPSKAEFHPVNEKGYYMSSL
jgi:competence protein ComEC